MVLRTFAVCWIWVSRHHDTAGRIAIFLVRTTDAYADVHPVSLPQGPWTSRSRTIANMPGTGYDALVPPAFAPARTAVKMLTPRNIVTDVGLKHANRDMPTSFTVLKVSKIYLNNIFPSCLEGHSLCAPPRPCCSRRLPVHCKRPFCEEATKSLK